MIGKHEWNDRRNAIAAVLELEPFMSKRNVQSVPYAQRYIDNYDIAKIFRKLAHDVSYGNVDPHDGEYIYDRFSASERGLYACIGLIDLYNWDADIENARGETFGETVELVWQEIGGEEHRDMPPLPQAASIAIKWRLADAAGHTFLPEEVVRAFAAIWQAGAHDQAYAYLSHLRQA